MKGYSKFIFKRPDSNLTRRGHLCVLSCFWVW